MQFHSKQPLLLTLVQQSCAKPPSRGWPGNTASVQLPCPPFPSSPLPTGWGSSPLGRWPTPGLGAEMRRWGEGTMRKKQEAKTTQVPHGSLLEMLCPVSLPRRDQWEEGSNVWSRILDPYWGRLCMYRSQQLRFVSCPIPR